MKNQKSFAFAIFIVLTFACLQTAALGQITSQSTDARVANVRAEGMGVRFDAAISYSSATLTVSAPDGNVYRREFAAGAAPSFALLDKTGAALGNGQYTYELRFTTVQPRSIKDRIIFPDDGGTGVEDENGRTSRRPLSVQSVVQSGSFAMQNGVLYIGNESEPTSGRPPLTKSLEKSLPQQRSGVLSGNTVSRLRNHRLSLLSMPDQVIPDDLIVQGSLCVGLDCVNNENFGFDTIRLKENNDRIQFDDTSTAAGFPTNNWQIRANSSASGGASFLAFVDQGATGNSETGTILFEVDAGAPANSLKVSSTGKVGLRTGTPVLDLHITTSDTPAHRLEQTSAGGFTAQTWDIAGNEANFFVRDVTGGSRLPFRIRPGAPTSSIDISASGNVGIGTASPGTTLHVKGPGNYEGIIRADSNAVDAYTGYGWYENGTKKWSVYNHPTIADTLLFANASGVDKVAIDQNGNVGIGTTAPTELLTVNGTASKPGGGTWSVPSDERLKNIKGRFNPGLKAVMQLQPIRYEYKRDNALGLKSEGEHIGFGAQALQKIIPEAVTKNSDGYLMVNNDPIIWTMLNAIKEQQKEIAELKGQVRKLQATSRRHRK
jgi:hypothetical protein